jgi:MHS family proline/betaine transporter-like MFS transporter
MLLNLFATSMVVIFVPANSHHNLSNVTIGYLGFSISFLFRPLGAFFFGSLGDKFGRKISMLFSLSFMSVSTLLLGFLPSAQVIGIFALIAFVACRAAQGMSVGGEYGSAMTYAFELSPRYATLLGSFVISSTHVGGFIAAICASHYSAQGPDGFRTPFIYAGLVGLFSILLRQLMIETYEGSASLKIKQQPVVSDGSKGSKGWLKSFCLSGFLVFVFYSSIIFLNEIMVQKGLAVRSDIFKINTFALGLWIVLPPIWGIMADFFGFNYIKMMRLGVILTIMTSILGLAVVDQQKSLEGFIFVQVFFTVFHSLFCFGTPCYISNLFQKNRRNMSVAVAYSLGASFTGAATPLICSGLVEATGLLAAIGIPCVILGVGCWAALDA